MTDVERHAELTFAESLFEKVRFECVAVFLRVAHVRRRFWELCILVTG